SFGRGSACSHQRSRYALRLFFSRIGLTFCRMYSNGASYIAALPSDISAPKSIIHASFHRVVIDRPLNQTLTTSLLGRPFGLSGFASHFLAKLPSISNGPFFDEPMNPMSRFSGSRAASV